ncbi:hypothetical protein [Streptomyces griseolus]|nr:hypothetical protein [Streptomyces griseolus]MCW8215507.1 hypothetical protein [Streptomyces griseolus]
MSSTPKPEPGPTPKPPERDPVLEDLIWLQQTREARLAAARAQRPR